MTSVVNCIIDKTFTAPTCRALLQKDYMPVHWHQAQALTWFDRWNVSRSNTCYFWEEILRCSSISLFHLPWDAPSMWVLKLRRYKINPHVTWARNKLMLSFPKIWGLFVTRAELSLSWLIQQGKDCPQNRRKTLEILSM